MGHMRFYEYVERNLLNIFGSEELNLSAKAERRVLDKIRFS
jgi:hypothetical protein